MTSMMMRNQMTDKMAEECRGLIKNKEFVKCEQMLRKAMEEEPHSPMPHNLMGILLEQKGEHSLAMKHFRAAYALDPTCTAASFNLEQFSNGESCAAQCAYTDADCLPQKPAGFFMKFVNQRSWDRDCKKKEKDEKKLHHNGFFAWNCN